jgi:hypothetical protein
MWVAVTGMVLIAAADAFTATGALLDGVSSLHEWGEMDGRAVGRGPGVAAGWSRS